MAESKARKLSRLTDDGANIIPMDPSLDASYEVGTIGKLLLNGRVFAVNLEDFSDLVVDGSWHLAFTAALATGAKRINLGLRNYNLSQPVAINRGNIAIVGPGNCLGVINLTGSAARAFDVGNLVSQTFHVYLNNIVFTRDSVAIGSQVMRIRNVSFFGLTGCRFYMDNKFGSALDIQYGIYHFYSDLRFENSIDHSVRIAGGAAGPGGSVGGLAAGLRWSDCIFNGANAGKSNPTTQASFIMEDYVQAVWMRNCEGYRHLGPMVDMRGTSAGVSANILCLFFNLNVESTFDMSSIIRMNYYVSCEVLGGWGEGRGMPSITMGTGSSSNRVVGVQLGITGSDCIEDSGALNRFENNELVGYSGAVCGVRWKPGSSKGMLKGGKASQMQTVAINEAGDNSSHHVTDVTSANISAAHFSGFNGGSNLVDDYRSLDSTPYATRSSSTLNVPSGLNGRPCRVIGATGNIDNLRAGDYYLEPLTLWLDPGMVVRDQSSSGGNIQLTTTASVAGDGRNNVKLAWDSSNTRWRTA